MKSIQRRLVFERIQLTHAALHEQKNTVFRFSRQVRFQNCQWVTNGGLRSHIGSIQVAQCERTDSIECTVQEMMPREGVCHWNLSQRKRIHCCLTELDTGFEVHLQ